jgi:hypothetical protein
MRNNNNNNNLSYYNNKFINVNNRYKSNPEYIEQFPN